jgi:lysophospholipase L1-like esterase
VLDRSLFLDPLLQPPEPPLHPSAEGQARMAAAMEPTLAALLGDRNHAGA